MTYKFVVPINGIDSEIEFPSPRVIVLSEAPLRIGQIITKTAYEIRCGKQKKIGEYKCAATVADILGFDPERTSDERRP